MIGKQDEAQEMLDELYGEIDSGGLSPYQQGMFEILTWLLEGEEKPEIK